MESPTVVSGPTASTSQVLPQGPSAARVPAATRASNRFSPYKIARQQAKALKDANGPNPNRKVARDKFLPLECHEMPTVITAWSEALAAIDRKTPPLLRGRLAPEWRDVLQGKVAEQGKAGTRAHARSAGLEDLLRPAFKACGISALSDFPRPDLCRTCFASETLVGLDFRESQRGLAALAVIERLPCLLRMAALMCDWSVPCERPAVINTAMERTEWDDAAVETMERAVARYYTGSFYELFGRAAVVPMRLEHTIGF
ncbi:hypothetical protein B0H14DRAFT_2562711 [Mycena olivaceomarginata]|nr:hypothetical protein B0H14DRAFT_2562711 [Mycena olivaceomarginata]